MECSERVSDLVIIVLSAFHTPSCLNFQKKFIYVSTVDVQIFVGHCNHVAGGCDFNVSVLMYSKFSEFAISEMATFKFHAMKNI